jgi:MFS family permease
LKKGSLAVLLGGMFVVMVGFGIIIPVMPFYILHFGASSVHLGLLMATYSVMQFIFAPLWGALSDRVGRMRDLPFYTGEATLALGLGATLVWASLLAGTRRGDGRGDARAQRGAPWSVGRRGARGTRNRGTLGRGTA